MSGIQIRVKTGACKDVAGIIGTEMRVRMGKCGMVAMLCAQEETRVICDVSARLRVEREIATNQCRKQHRLLPNRHSEGETLS